MNKTQLQEQFAKLRTDLASHKPVTNSLELPEGFEHMSLQEILRVTAHMSHNKRK